MTHVGKNYHTDNGDTWVIGGKLVVKEGAEVTGLGETPVTENQTASTATTVAGLKDDFNALLEKLKTAGLMTADAEPDPDPEPGE